MLMDCEPNMSYAHRGRSHQFINMGQIDLQIHSGHNTVPVKRLDALNLCIGFVVYNLVYFS